MDNPDEHLADNEPHDEENPEQGAQTQSIKRSIHHIRKQLLEAFAIQSDHQRMLALACEQDLQELGELSQPIFELLQRLGFDIQPIPGEIVANLAYLMFPNDPELRNQAYDIDDHEDLHPMVRVTQLRRTLWYMIRRALGPDTRVPSLSNPKRIKMYVEAALRTQGELN